MCLSLISVILSFPLLFSHSLISLSISEHTSCDLSTLTIALLLSLSLYLSCALPLSLSCALALSLSIYIYVYLSLPLLLVFSRSLSCWLFLSFFLSFFLSLSLSFSLFLVLRMKNSRCFSARVGSWRCETLLLEAERSFIVNISGALQGWGSKEGFDVRRVMSHRQTDSPLANHYSWCPWWCAPAKDAPIRAQLRLQRSRSIVWCDLLLPRNTCQKAEQCQELSHRMTSVAFEARIWSITWCDVGPAHLRFKVIFLAHRNRSDFCDLRLRCPSRTPEMARFPKQEAAMMHCDLRVRWKVASDLRFRAAISEPETLSCAGFLAIWLRQRGNR